MSTTTVFTNVGDNTAASQFDAATGFYIAWGTGTSTPLKTDTALQTPSAESRVSMSHSASSAVWTATGTIVSSSNQSLSEAGVFSASTSGNLYVHTVFTAIAINTGDSIAFTIQVTFN